jgi:uncharacterized protein (DUF2141 family)
MHSVKSAGVLALSLMLAGCPAPLPPAGETLPQAPSRAPAGGGAQAPGEQWTARVDPFPVYDEYGQPYTFPFLGGFNVPRPQFADIDGDGDLDLFVQERTGELIFFENTGSAREPKYTWRTDRWQDLDIGEWNRFIDLDGDGDLDLLAEQRYSYVRFYRNEGSARAPRFSLAADSVRAPDGTAIFSDRQNIPNIHDIDCNGQLDLFLGRVDGTITRYEMAGRSSSGIPSFRFVTDRFEGISIVAQIVGMRHGANTMFFADADEDGDTDLFWGDFFEAGVLFIENHGTCASPSLQSEPVPLRAVDDSIRTSGYNVPVLVDIDGDRDLDLFVGVLGGAYNPNRTIADNFYFYERQPDGLHLRTRRYLTVIDVGSESIPALADLDGDGDLDLIVANKIDPKKLDTSRLYRFENTGTRTAPRFALRDTLDLRAQYHQAPAFGDLDGDGDLDLLLGTWNQGLSLYRNDGSARQSRFALIDSAYITLTRGSNATPALGDIDGDGDLDLFVGEASGELNFYRNEGTRASPRFVLVSDTFGGIDPGRRSAPALVDLDGDGLLDLVVGGEEGGALVYRNRGTATEPRFVLDTTATLPLPHFATPAFGDLDGDGDLDLISGSMSGGLVFLERRQP